MPTQTQIQQATLRIHRSLDKDLEPATADVIAIGGEPALQTLRESRSEMREKVKDLQRDETAQRTQATVLKVSQSQGERDLPGEDPTGKAEKPLSRNEQDYFDFVHDRLGPMMVLVLWLGFRDWEKASFYALNPTECNQIAKPVARIASRLETLLHAPKWVHMVTTTSDDTVTLLYAMAGYLDRIGILKYMVPSIASLKGPEKPKGDKAGWFSEKKVKNEPVRHPEQVQRTEQPKQWSNGHVGRDNTVNVPEGTALFAGWLAE